MPALSAERAHIYPERAPVGDRLAMAGAQASPTQGAQFPVIAPTTWPAAAVPPRDQRRYHGLPVDLFDGQSSPQGSWMMTDVAGCAVRTGITGSDVAERRWATVAVGSQLGFQLGYHRPSREAE